MSYSSIPDTSTELQFLSSHVMWNMYLMVYRPDGSPTGYPMLAAYHDGSLEFTTYRTAAKTKRILDDPRICCVVRSRIDEPPVALATWGTAVEVTDDDHFMNRPNDEVGPIQTPGAMRSVVTDRLDRGKRMVFRMPIERAQFLPVPESDESSTGAAHVSP